MFIQEREASRRFFWEIWSKYKASEPLQPLEELVLGVILEHAEYHEYLVDEEVALNSEFTPEMGVTNPFLHMGMHIAIKEQLSTDRPQGIKALCQALTKQQSSESHSVEHKMMECLGEMLWRAQSNNTLPDEQAYLECLRKIQ